MNLSKTLVLEWYTYFPASAASGHTATSEGPKVDRANFSITSDVAQSIKAPTPSAFQIEVYTYMYTFADTVGFFKE